MRIIGVTGGIASGKSTVTGILKENGAYIIDADNLAHQCMLPGMAAYQALIDAFGQDIVAESGHIDRKILGGIVFADRQALLKLNAITHTHVTEMIKRQLADVRAAHTYKIAVVDCPLPVKEGFLDLCDEIWVVVASLETRIQRIYARNGLPREQALARIEAQPSEQAYRELADVIIENDGISQADLRQRIEGMTQ